MSTILVSRDPVVADWAREAGIMFDEHLVALPPAGVRRGDVVLGQLGPAEAAAVCARGAVFRALVHDPAPADGPLTSAGLERLNPRFRRFEVIDVEALRQRRAASDARAPEQPEDVALDREWERRQAREGRRVRLQAVGCLFGAILLGAWFPDLLLEGLRELDAPMAAGAKLGAAAVAAILLYLVLAVLYRLRHRFIRSVATTHTPGEPDKRKVLVIGLSPLRRRRDGSLHDDASATLELLRRRLAEGATVADLARPGGMGPRALSWQQSLRAVEVHLPRLCRILVITSWESDQDLPLFAEIVGGALRNTPGLETVPEIRRVGPGVSFENHNALTRRIDEAVRMAGVPHEEISLETTTGTRPYAIAVALATMNSRLEYVYVNNQGRPVIYDSQVELGDPVQVG